MSIVDGASGVLPSQHLTQALADASSEGEPVDSIVFWSTPLGRPLYESLGFVVADSLDVWTFRASKEDMAAVGSG